MPFLVLPVVTFVFLSGFLVPRKRRADASAFPRRRVSEMVTLNTVWTVAHIVAMGALTPLTVLAVVIVDVGSVRLYYLIAYIQFVLLTP